MQAGFFGYDGGGSISKQETVTTVTNLRCTQKADVSLSSLDKRFCSLQTRPSIAYVPAVHVPSRHMAFSRCARTK